MPDTSDFDALQTSIKRQMPLVFAISSLVNLLLLTTAMYMLQIYDRVLSSGSYDTLIWLSVVAIFAILMYGLLEYSRRLIFSRTAFLIDRSLTRDVLERIMRLRMAGKMPDAGVRDVADFRNYYHGDAALAFYDVPWSIVFVAFIWALHPALGMFALFGAVVLFALTFINDLLTRHRQKEAAAKSRLVNESAMRLLESGETIMPLGMAPRLLDRWRDAQEEARGEQQSLGERSTTLLSLARSVRLGLQIGILGIGAFFVLGGALTAGAMIAASIVLGRALGPIERITAAWSRRTAAAAAAENLRELFADKSAAKEDQIRLPAPEGRLDVQNASFVPHGSKTPTLIDASFSIAPGNVCAMLGPSGAGKSTLCRLLVGAWKPTSGQVRLDGADVFQWHDEQLGPKIGFLPQRVEMFPGTIAENIARFSSKDSDEIIKAAKLASVHDLILKMPQGYETQVGGLNDVLSLGQRQRLALARAVFGNPNLIVLDEPNANLDTAGDSALLSALSELKKRLKTIIVVSHRPEILGVADKVLILMDGVVEGFGDRDDLVQLQPNAVDGKEGGAAATRRRLVMQRVEPKV